MEGYRGTGEWTGKRLGDGGKDTHAEPSMCTVFQWRVATNMPEGSCISVQITLTSSIDVFSEADVDLGRCCLAPVPA